MEGALLLHAEQLFSSADFWFFVPLENSLTDFYLFSHRRCGDGITPPSLTGCQPPTCISTEKGELRPRTAGWPFTGLGRPLQEDRESDTFSLPVSPEWSTASFPFTVFILSCSYTQSLKLYPRALLPSSPTSFTDLRATAETVRDEEEPFEKTDTGQCRFFFLSLSRCVYAKLCF